MLPPDPETWAASLFSPFYMVSEAAITSGNFCVFCFFSAFLSCHQPANTLYWDICLLPWCFAYSADMIPDVYSWLPSWPLQCIIVMFGLFWQLPICSPWERSCSSCFVSYLWTQHIVGLSLSSKIMKSLCHIPRFSYNLDTKWILFNIYPRTNQVT